MQKVESSIMTDLLSQEPILEAIFQYVPLSSAPKITLVSKVFRDVWNKTRYELACKRLFQSDSSFSRVQYAVKKLRGESAIAEMMSIDVTALKVVKRTIDSALSELRPFDKKELFDHLKPTIARTSQLQPFAIFTRLKKFLYPWTPHSMDLLEEPGLLIATCERAIKQQDVYIGVYLSGPYNYV